MRPSLRRSLLPAGSKMGKTGALDSNKHVIMRKKKKKRWFQLQI